MSEEVKMTQEEIEQKKIKGDWEDSGHVGNYKIGKLGYHYIHDNRTIRCKELELASIDDATKLCGGVLDKGIFFDNSTGLGNFHFAPKEKELNEIKIFDIYQNLCEIRTALSIKLKDMEGMKVSNTQAGSTFIAQGYNDYKNHVFAYNRVNLGNVVYDMTGVRFSNEKDEDGVGRISCSIGELQMMRIIPTRIMKKKNLKSVDFYPNTIMEHEDIDQLITTNYNENKDYFYYNPPFTIYDNMEEIVEKFIEFIIKCEEKYKDK